MEEELKMISSFMRDKIPHALSFVASAKMLSLAWQNVPQFDLLKLWFRCDVPKSLRPSTTPRLIVEVMYYSGSINRFMPSTWENDPKWWINVGVCRREDAYEVRQWLRDTGLEQAKLWFEQLGHSGGSWRATFDEDSRAFEIRHN